MTAYVQRYTTLYMAQMSIRLSEEVQSAAKHVASSYGMSVSDLIRGLLAQEYAAHAKMGAGEIANRSLKLRRRVR